MICKVIVKEGSFWGSRVFRMTLLRVCGCQTVWKIFVYHIQTSISCVWNFVNEANVGYMEVSLKVVTRLDFIPSLIGNGPKLIKVDGS